MHGLRPPAKAPRVHPLAVGHDPDLLRVAGRAERIAALTFEELRRHEVGSWKNPGFHGERIPELDEILLRTPPNKRVFVELRGGPELVPALARTGFAPAELVAISFNLEAAREAKRALDCGEACWIVDRETAGPSADIARLVQAARRAGLDGWISITNGRSRAKSCGWRPPQV